MHSYDVAGFHIRGFLEGLRVLQIDTDTLLQEVGIDHALLAETEVRFPELQVMMLWMGAERRYGKPTFGMDLALSIPFGKFELVDYLIAGCPTVGAAFESLDRHARLCSSGFYYRIDPHTHNGQPGKLIVSQHQHAVAAVPSGMLEYTWTLLVSRFRFACGTAFTPQLWLRERPRASHAQLREALGHLPEVGAQDALFVTNAQWELENQRQDPMLHKLLVSHARDVEARLPTHTFENAVHGAIAFALQRGEPTIGRVASRLGMSARTLQRRLEAESGTFQRSLEQVRRDMAFRYLTHTQLSLSEISGLLAYADMSAFCRAFRRWTGASPASVRQQQRAQRAERVPTSEPVLPGRQQTH